MKHLYPHPPPLIVHLPYSPPILAHLSCAPSFARLLARLFDLSACKLKGKKTAAKSYHVPYFYWISRGLRKYSLLEILICNKYNTTIYIDYFIESATYGFLFTSCKTLENSLVRCAHSFVFQSLATSE